MTDVQILIHKQGKNTGFLVEAVILDGQLNLNQVHVSGNLQEYHQKLLTGNIEPDVYQGPDFGTLDENLRQAFFDFCSELGVNEECASFIEMTSLHKDQQLYMNWLKNAKQTLI